MSTSLGELENDIAVSFFRRLWIFSPCFVVSHMSPNFVLSCFSSIHAVLLISREGSYRAVVGLEHDLGTTKERVAMKDILYE